MTITIYHNPRCSKSRQSLALIDSAGVTATIVEYLREPPDAETIQGLANMLGVPVAALLRQGETEFKEANDVPDLDDDAALAMWISRNPKVLQRPIVVDEAAQRAVIGRPPENVQDLLAR